MKCQREPHKHSVKRVNFVLLVILRILMSVFKLICETLLNHQMQKMAFINHI